ncbi:DEAD/DEAH box helicase [Prosthecobacter dejongeii]|uniref:Probable DNA 3'-5' helicase RecG n=1 Tax=Prosthecobacter dejongeii TaxID=48465 RepID=A0A7W8DR14_9BACT|nr:DEAD/DEAH box helicase [Prosthecobacter dejongeii]MBB5038795.1 RecG-like helicase/REP element-mobilizing transposase RayT [Prosthecobacter dejongeii]
MPLALDASLSDVPGLSSRVVKALAKEQVMTVGEIVNWLPFRHEDRRQMEGATFQVSELPACYQVQVTKTGNKYFGARRGAGLFEAQVEPIGGAAMGGLLTLRWWNMPFMSRAIAEGQELIIYGKVKEYKDRLLMDHPEYEVLGDEEETTRIHSGRITPVYRLKSGVTQKTLRTATWHVMQSLGEDFTRDLLPPPSQQGEFAGWSRARAIKAVHFTETMEDLEKARRYLALEEFYGYQLRVVRRRRAVLESGGHAHAAGPLAQEFEASLPFQMTGAQKRSLEEIQRDMASNAPMNRLLHGDVGSGKTVVAFAAMLGAVEAGKQAAMMAPTQILAEQHFLTARKWLEPLGLNVSLRTGTRAEDGGTELWSARVPQAVSRVSRETVLKTAREVHYAKRRLPHFERPWGKYFLTFTTALRRPLPPEARKLALEAVLHFHGQRYQLYAACVMPDHVHLLLEPGVKNRDPETGDPVFYPLGELLHSIKSFSSKAILKLGWEDARVWEKETFDRLIRSEADLQETFGYIVSNPREEGLVTHAQEYEWLWPPLDGVPRDAELSTRDACAPCKKGPEIVIGTHALLHDEELVRNLGLVVIDEQHKFGVAQRARLIQKGNTPDVLVMTATPIPRTLTLTIYGDLDVSTIDERPKERGKIITKVRPATKQKEAAKFLKEQLEEGRQGYLVYPLIEESEKLDATAAKKGHEEWTKLLPHFQVGLLHGKLSSEEKELVMRDFRAGKLDVLVSTTVIEVGVDVPNATVMYIHNAERFGLAQLHQLRGRIGRGEHTSYCVLFVKDKDEEAKSRLAIMEETTDGFRISEEDLKRRGPGDVLGKAQSGQAPLKFAELLADTRLVRLARQLAEKTLDEDPQMQAPRLAELRPFVFQEDTPQAMMQ